MSEAARDDQSTIVVNGRDAAHASARMMTADGRDERLPLAVMVGRPRKSMPIDG